jgi:hypothetical protein
MKQESAVMTRIHIRETTNAAPATTEEQQQPRDGSKSPSPARRAAAAGVVEKKEAAGDLNGNGVEVTAKRPGVSDESGYYEEEEQRAASLQAEDSVEIIFDKNASNNNLGADGRSPNTGSGHF